VCPNVAKVPPSEITFSIKFVPLKTPVVAIYISFNFFVNIQINNYTFSQFVDMVSQTSNIFSQVSRSSLTVIILVNCISILKEVTDS